MAVTPPKAALAYVVMASGAAGLTLGDFFIKKSALAGVSIAGLLVCVWPLTIVGLVVLARLQGGIRHHLYPRAPGKLLIRAGLLLVMSLLNLTSLSLNPYAQHAMLFQLSPVFALLIAVAILGEELTGRVVMVLLTCLVGTWLILDPALTGISLTLLLAVAAALSNATTNVFIAANHSHATFIGFTFWAMNGVVAVVGTYWLLFEGAFPPLEAQIWIQLSALFSVSGIVLAGLAMQMARENFGRVAIMLYVQMPVALVLGWLAFGERPSILAILGGVLIALAGASLPLMASRDRKRRAA